MFRFPPRPFLLGLHRTPCPVLLMCITSSDSKTEVHLCWNMLNFKLVKQESDLKAVHGWNGLLLLTTNRFFWSTSFCWNSASSIILLNDGRALIFLTPLIKDAPAYPHYAPPPDCRPDFLKAAHQFVSTTVSTMGTQITITTSRGWGGQPSSVGPLEHSLRHSASCTKC